MKLRSIVWVGITVIITGCSERQTNLVATDHGDMFGLFGLELGVPIDPNNSKQLDEGPQPAGVRGRYVVTPPVPSGFFSKYEVGADSPSGGIVYIFAEHRSANQSIASTFDEVERRLKSQIGRPDEDTTDSRNGVCQRVWHQTLRSGQTVKLRLTKVDGEKVGYEKDPAIIQLSLVTMSGGVRAVSAPPRSVKTAQANHVEITGVFGLKLGDSLPAQLVRKIDGWSDMAEAGVYCVTPPKPSDVFTDYTVELLGGPIHKINASRNGRGQALVSIYDDAKKELTSQFGPPTSTGAVDARGDSGIAWEQNLRYGGRVRMTLAMRKDSNAGYVVPGMVTLELQKFR